MAKLFEQFHLSMIEREQLDLLVTPALREDWLRSRLSSRIEFKHMGKDMYWIPKDWSGELLTAIVERQRAKAQHFGPDEGAEEFIGEEWQGSIIIIDPIHRPDGQKMAFEYDKAVGQPSAILSSLVAFINSDATNQYALHFKPLIQGGSFARFASKHGNVLQYVSFKFTVPNMLFGLGTKTTDGLKRLGKDTGAQEVDLKLESDDGVRANTETIQEAVEYAEEGNARVTAKARNGEYWSSTRRKVTITMQRVIDFASEHKEGVEKWLTEALDRDQDHVGSDADDANRGTRLD